MKPYFEFGGISIYHGDSREILPELGRFDLLLTDPPYGLGAARKDVMGFGDKRGKNGMGGKNPSKRDYGDSAWDDVACDQELIDLCRGVCNEHVIWAATILRFRRPNACLFGTSCAEIPTLRMERLHGRAATGRCGYFAIDGTDS